MNETNCEIEHHEVVFISAATLEDRLLYDDVFVNYFNLFLQSKAFGTSIRYEKLDGYYLERPPGVSDDLVFKELANEQGKFFQQSAITLWVKAYRLPFFLRSHLFLEYKLCKLFLRKLSSRSRVEPSRLQLRGYSRLTTPQQLPDFFTDDWNENSPVDYTSEMSWPTRTPGQHHHRPLGSASSLPPMLFIALQRKSKAFERYHGRETLAKIYQEDGDEKLQEGEKKDEMHERLANIRSEGPFTPEEMGENKKKHMHHRRTKSAPVDGISIRFKEIDLDENDVFFKSHDEIDNDDSTLCFGNDSQDLEKTEAELQSIIDETKQNLQEMKEDALNSPRGMSAFREFLTGTCGFHLIDFWLDMEMYKHIEELTLEDGNTSHMLRMKVFREINDKYKNCLSGDAKKKIREAIKNDGPSVNMFNRIQYDTLRRLRSYWIPRYLVHREKLYMNGCRESRLQSRQSNGGTSALNFLPKISFVRSLPPRAEWCEKLARRSCDWSKNLTLSNVKANLKTDLKSESFCILQKGLSYEKSAGWPFHAFLKRMNKKEDLVNLMFWQSVEDLRNEERRGCDRHLHLCNAWNIVQRFLSKGNESSLNLNEFERRKIIERLRQTFEASSDIFKFSQTCALESLQKPWKEYLQDEIIALKKFVKASIGERPTHSKSNSKRESINQNFFFPGKWYPRYPESSPSERQRRLHTAMTIAENIETTRMSLSSPQKTPSKREKKESRVTSMTTEPPGSQETDVKSKLKKEKQPIRPLKQQYNDGTKVEEAEIKPEEKPSLEFRNFVNNTKVMSSFKHFIQNTEGRHASNALSMYLDIELFKLTGTNKTQRSERASQIYRDYLDQSSRKWVDIPNGDTFLTKDECPSTAVLQKAQDCLLFDIDASFQEFCKSSKLFKSSSHQYGNGTTAKVEANYFALYYKRRRNKFKGRLQPTKDDKENFVNELRETFGVLSSRLELFRRYLDGNDDVKGEHVSKLENGLFFYLEVQKFKDLFLYMDDTTLLKKVDAIVDCFLDSATPPSVQIDISTDLAGRTVQKVQSLHGRSKLSRDQRDSLIFDEAQNAVLKELLPFWAGFTRQDDVQFTEKHGDQLPPSRRQVINKKRFSAFMKFPLRKRPVSLRSVHPGVGQSKRELNYSLANGLAWKENVSDEAGSVYSLTFRGNMTS